MEQPEYYKQPVDFSYARLMKGKEIDTEDAD